MNKGKPHMNVDDHCASSPSTHHQVNFKCQSLVLGKLDPT